MTYLVEVGFNTGWEYGKKTYKIETEGYTKFEDVAKKVFNCFDEKGKKAIGDMVVIYNTSTKRYRKYFGYPVVTTW